MKKIFLLLFVFCACKHASTELTETYWDNAKTKLKEHYFVLKDDHSKKEEEYVSYYADGKKEFIKHFHNNQLIDSFWHFNANGKLIEKCFYKDGNLEGDRFLYNDSGVLITIEPHINGAFHGLYKSFYDNSKPKELGNYNYNKMEGEWKYFFDNGNLKEIVKYVGGSENGDYKAFYPTGKLKSIGFYKDEKEDSTWHNYYENGKLMEIVNYKAGTENGLTQMFSKDSVLIREIIYKNGMPIDYNDLVNHIHTKHDFDFLKEK